MEEIKLDVQVRDQIGRRKVKVIRQGGYVPAVVYGGDSGPTAIQVNKPAYEKIMRHHKGQSVVFHLNVLEGEKKLRDYSVILKDEQYHPVSDDLVHIDFNRISLTEEIEVQVPIEVKGDPIGVKRDGGTLDHPLWELDVICLPTNIPQSIVVNVEALEIGDAVHVKDLSLPAGVRTEHDPESIVASVVPPMKEEEEIEEEEPQEPEVTKEKKDKEVKAEEPEKGDEKKK